MKAVIGLGNPDENYSGNRHNAGFMAVEFFCREKSLLFERKKRFQSEVAEWKDGRERTVFLKPLTYMNLSGEAVARVLNFYKILPQDMLVIYDDFHLPIGTIRVRERGSSGGHNGMESIIRETGFSDFPRVRIGIGTAEFETARSRGRDQIADYVLSDFSKEEKDQLSEVISQCAKVIELFLSGQVGKAMNRFNKRPRQEASGRDEGEGS